VTASDAAGRRGVHAPCAPARGARPRARGTEPGGRLRARARRRVVGEGWHQEYGGPHAEVEALRAAGAQARGATAYVTLEPCNHWGKTPPCTDALLAAGVARVVAAVRDPFPAAAGGAERLRAAGVAVDVGTLGTEARELNAPFLFAAAGAARPWVTLKLALSLDGAVADHTAGPGGSRVPSRGRRCTRCVRRTTRSPWASAPPSRTTPS
jgi:riboflavin biosynthesis protein RibD